MMQIEGRKKRLRLAALAAVVGALLLGPIVPAWSSPLQRPDRQTVPLTPPATWTPIVPAGQGEPTSRPRPTALPTLERRATESGSSTVGSTLGGTPKSESPIEELVVAIPWFEMTSDVSVVEPGRSVVARAHLANLGNAPQGPAIVRISRPTSLVLHSAETTDGQVAQPSTNDLVWEVPGLAAGQEVVLELLFVTPDVLWPGTQMIVHGQVTMEGSTPLDANIELTAPLAILPQAGQP